MTENEKADKKFTGTITKVKDGTAVGDDEWICFLFKDTVFVEYALPAYEHGCVQSGADSDQLRMVRELRERAARWREAHPERCKVPDAAGERVLP